LLHGLGNVVVVLLFVIAWSLRSPSSAAVPPFALVLSFIGVGIVVVTGWLGGELVDRLGIGVDNGAYPDAPSSLSGHVASQTSGTSRDRQAA
jgi:uncharacterized membrane protein